jgi:hypothetical protein
VPDLVFDVALSGERIAIPFSTPRYREIFEFRFYVGGSVPASDARLKFRGVVVRYAGY